VEDWLKHNTRDCYETVNLEDCISSVLPLPNGYDAETGEAIYTEDPKCWPIFIEGLQYFTSDTQLCEVFHKYGEILEIEFIEDQETGCSMGKAIMWFRSMEQRDSAVEASGIIVDKVPIKVSRPTADSWDSMKSGFFANIPRGSGGVEKDGGGL